MALSGDIPNRNDRLITTPQVARAVEAAEVLFDAGDPGAVDIYEPRNSLEANAAVRRLGQSFEELPGTITRVLEAASGSAELLSSDRLQGLAEIVQNADDAGASQVRLLLTPTDLLVTHDGKPVRLRHVLGFATPWLSTKSDDPASVGRFGIGLMTLRALSATLEVHCPPYHVRIGEPTISPVDSSTLPPGFQKEGWTTLRIPVREGSISSEELVAWLDRWDDAALLFLRHVSRVTLLAPAGKPIRELSLRRTDHEVVVVGETTTVETILRHHAEVDDGRSWAVFSTEVESPKGLSRARKATGRTTPIAVALPLSPVHSGMVYAGLPVAATTSPLFVSAQYDPLTSRLDFADNEWNRALVPLVARLWSHAALDLFSRDPKAAWLAMPVTKTPEGEDTRWSVVRQIEEQATNRARYWLSSCLSFRVQGKGPISLSELAVEARPLEHILT
ncbi:MAG: hypothetical protein OXS35_01085, partial [Dehalococcoidia bacterium]|nr:hypothetical protein [Dehalococcoidia bacterium]